jgi:hypothetical protein
MRSIITICNGTRYRSRLEARWAEFFRLLGWRAFYEPFDLDGYIPDFILHGCKERILVEVKPVTGKDDPLFKETATKIEKSGWKHEALIVSYFLPQSRSREHRAMAGRMIPADAAPMKASDARDPPSEEISEAEAFAPTWSRKDDPWSSPSWKRAAADYHADRKRGAAEPPLTGNGFCGKCAEADRRVARRRPQHDLPANWDTMSVGALWHALNDPRRHSIPKSIIDSFQYLIKQGDRERLKAWLASRASEERRALRKLREKSS